MGPDLEILHTGSDFQIYTTVLYKFKILIEMCREIILHSK